MRKKHIDPYMALWLEDGKGLCMLKVDTCKHIGTWGIMRADAVGHIANALEQQGLNRDEVRAEVLDFFHREMAAPTDTVTGNIAIGDES